MLSQEWRLAWATRIIKLQTRYPSASQNLAETIILAESQTASEGGDECNVAQRLDYMQNDVAVLQRNVESVHNKLDVLTAHLANVSQSLSNPLSTPEPVILGTLRSRKQPPPMLGDASRSQSLSFNQQRSSSTNFPTPLTSNYRTPTPPTSVRW